MTRYPDSEPYSLCYSLMLRAMWRINKYHFYSLWLSRQRMEPINRARFSELNVKQSNAKVILLNRLTRKTVV